MKVEATVYVNEGNNKIKANANITIEECFVVKGIRIIEGSNGLFTAMPSRKGANGDYVDVCFPITKEFRAAINDEILRAYYEKLGQQEQQSKLDYVPFSDNDVPPLDMSDLPF
jgi:stage V sporulation protein G